MNLRALALALGIACTSTDGQRSAGSAPRAAPLRPGERAIAGRITGVGRGEVSIETEGGETRTLRIVPRTAIQLDGQGAVLEDLAPGQRARATFEDGQGRGVAVTIDAGEFTVPPDSAGTEAAPSGGAPPADRGSAPEQR